MSDSAHVTSIDAVASFGRALRTFTDEASRAIVALDEQARRALEWLEHEAPVWWRQEIRRCYDGVDRARSALETCRMKTVAGNRPACLEEIEALRAAQRKLRQAEEKIEVVRRWAQRVRREIDNYRGKTGGLRHCLEGDIPRTLALLERTVATLESYADRPRESES